MTASLPSTSPSVSPTLSGSRQKIPPLKAHEIRWFYEEPGKAWIPFNGHDSLCLEDCYQKLQTNKGSAGGCEVSVLGDAYEANILEKICKPIYWTGQWMYKYLYIPFGMRVCMQGMHAYTCMYMYYHGLVLDINVLPPSTLSSLSLPSSLFQVSSHGRSCAVHGLRCLVTSGIH